MLGASRWAFVKPIQKYFNDMTITFVSVIAALAVGEIEALGLIARKLGFNGIFCDSVRTLNENFGLPGYFIVAFFAVSWIHSIAFYKWRRYEEPDAEI